MYTYNGPPSDPVPRRSGNVADFRESQKAPIVRLLIRLIVWIANTGSRHRSPF